MTEPWQAELLADKESSGYSPSLHRTQSVKDLNKEPFVMDLPGSKVKRSVDLRPGMNTISSWRPSPRKCLYPELLECLEEAPMVNSQDQKLPTNMWEKKRLALEQRLNLGLNRFGGTPRPTGSPYGPPPSPEISMPSQQMSEWLVIMPCELSEVTSHSLKQLKEEFMSFGVVQERANHGVLGMKQELVLTLSVLEPSFGTATRINNTLLLMNFVEVLMWRTCSDGLTVIRSVWKSKEAQDLSMPLLSGLQAM